MSARGLNTLLYLALDLKQAGRHAEAADAHDIEADWWEEQGCEYWAKRARQDAEISRATARAAPPSSNGSEKL